MSGKTHGENTMSSSGFASNQSGGGAVSESLTTPHSEPVSEPGLMERVLRETLAVTDPDAPLDAAQWGDLQAVARRYAGEPLSMDPVLVLLVQAILGARFAALPRRDELGESVARRIAETLWDDPPSQARLHRLWAHLTEAVR
jgi:hypothetical protein